MRYAPAGLLALALAACDVSSTAPLPPSTNQAEEPLLDALERIAPTLGGGPAATALRTALGDAVADANPAALAAVASALAAVEAEQPDAAVETDVIRLALAAQR
jgi:hypothetical protein